ncbi:hypothetical protein Tco_0791153 [Tanacetum coccineum]
MQAARDRKKSYADIKRKLIDFQVGDKVMLKVSPWKGVVRFSKRGKLNPRYVGPFKVLEKVGSVAYKLELPKKLSKVHNTFHVSNLKKCYADEPLAVPLDGLHFDDKLQFIEEPVEIMDHEVKQLRRSRVPIVKVRWNSRRGLEFTWEREDQFQKKYPHLFTKTAPSSNTVMSDSEDFMVTYTAVSSPFRGLSAIRSLRVDGPPVMPKDPYAYVVAAFQTPPSPNYVPGPEYPPSPDFIPEPVYLEFMPPEDEVLTAEEQPLPAAASPTADSPGYVPKSDPEEDHEEDDDEDPEEDPADYLANGGDDGDDEDELSDDDEDDDVDKEEEHTASADSTAVALPAVDHAPSAEETEPFETNESATTPPPHPAYRVTTRISIRDEPPTPFWSATEVSRLLAIPTPPPSPLSLWSSPLPQIPSPPLPVSPLPPASPTYPLGYQAAMIRLRVEAPFTSHSPPPHIILSHTRAYTPPSGTPPSGTPPLLPIPLPTSSPSLLLPSADHGADRPEVCLPPQKRLCFAFGPRYEIIRDLKRDVGYGITDTWDEMLVDMSGAPATDDTKVVRRMTEFTTRGWRAYARTSLLMEREAGMSREAWGRSMDASDLARSEVMSLRTTVLGQQAMITELQAADHRRQAAITKLLAVDHKRQT